MLGMLLITCNRDTSVDGAKAESAGTKTPSSKNFLIFDMRKPAVINNLLNGAKKEHNACETGRMERRYRFDWCSSCEPDHQGRSL